MKRLLIIILFPLCSSAQTKQTLGQAYIGLMLHDFSQPGISTVASIGVSKYVGIGAGADVTSYKKSIIAPVYADLRLKYPVNSLVPFAIGQIGTSIYNRTDGTGIYMTDVTGGNRREIMLKKSGSMFFGGGLGLSYKANRVGYFVSAIIRNYKFNNSSHNIAGKEVNSDSNESMGVITGGLVF
jgi:hypothetical protein